MHEVLPSAGPLARQLLAVKVDHPHVELGVALAERLGGALQRAGETVEDGALHVPQERVGAHRVEPIVSDGEVALPV